MNYFGMLSSVLESRHRCAGIVLMKSLLIIVIIQSLMVGITFAQEKPSARRWSVRKTGEFGRKIVIDTNPSGSAPFSTRRLPLSQELELPSRQLRLQARATASRGHGQLDTAETRVYSENSQFFRGAGAPTSGLEIRKPSLDLELPKFVGGLRSFVADQEAQETEDNDVGYVYPKPQGEELEGPEEIDNSNGYNYPTPPPGVKLDEPENDQTTVAPELPDPAKPEVVAGDQVYSFSPSPIKGETDELVDAAGLNRNRAPPPSSPQVQGIPSSEEHDKSACSGSDDDPNCWPHGYEGVIPGKAGEDYPILSEIVQTPFNCDDQTYSGYYADFDPQARCQIYHVCLKRNRYRKTQQWSFLCPNGTIFSQPDFVCVWWGDAPECSDTMVRSLYNLNEQLGWDNITEGGGTKQGGEQLQTSMSAFNAKTAKQSSALPYRVPVKVPEGNSGRHRTKLQEVTQNTLSGHRNIQDDDLDYGEHEGEESSNFETSLRQQSESRSKSKSGSNLHKSYSEGYELKGSPDSVQPFIVNRGPPTSQAQNQAPPPSAPTENPQYESQDVVMMPTLQRFPDGSEGYAEVPVMRPHHSGGGPTTQSPTHDNLQQQQGYDDDLQQEGYQYPNPTSTPAPTYLPPRRSTTARSTPPPTTTEYYPPPTIPTEPPISPAAEYENYEQQSPDRVTTTEEPEGYQYPQPTTTDGYNYPNLQNPQQSQQQQQLEEDGYNYPQPTTTERQAQPAFQETNEDNQDTGYRYPNPTTTQRSSRFRQTIPTTTEVVTESTTTEEPYEDGYNYQAPTAGSQFESLRETTTEAQEQNGYNYQRPTTTENYNDLVSTQQSADLIRDEDQISTTPQIPTTTEIELPSGGYLPPRNNELSNQQLEGPDASNEDIDYEEDVDANEVVTDSSANAAPQGQGLSNAEDDESGYSYHLPTPPSSNVVLNGGALDSDEKLNEILKQIQSGGIEAVDANGKPIEFSKLKELLLNSPRGSVELKGELDSVTSASTETSTTPYESGPSIPAIPEVPQGPSGPSAGPQQQQPEQPIYHTVTTAQIIPNNGYSQNNNIFNTNSGSSPSSLGGVSTPSGLYLPPNNNNNNQNNAINNQQQQYYNGQNNNEVVRYVDHPGYEIKTPTREFETHSVDLNSIAVDTSNSNNLQNQRPFSQRQPQSGYYQQQQQQQPQTSPQRQFFQQTPPQGNYLPPPQQQVLQQQQVQQPLPVPDYDRSNVLNSLPLPTPQRQQQQQQSLPQSRPNGEYLPPRQATSSILQPQYYQQPSHLSQPIQLTENIQLQQSFALPTQQPLLPTSNTGRNPLIDPKDIKIVPALFVHQHTSVASQDNHSGPSGGSRNFEDAFQNLDTAQSNYYSSATSNLAQQLTQLHNLTPQSSSYSTGQRQFYRRSHPKNGGNPTSSPVSVSPTHTIDKAHQVSSFTIEDARTPEELQKYHHEDLKRFHTQTIVSHGSILDDAQVSPSSHPPTTRATLPIIASIAREAPKSQSSRSDTKSTVTSGSTRFSLPVANKDNDEIRNSNRDVPPSGHRNEEYFIPVSGTYGGGGGGGGGNGGSSSSISSSTSSRNSNGGGGSIVRNSNNNDNNNYSQFRVSGQGSGSRGGGGGGSGSGRSSSSSYHFLDSERTLLSRFLPEREGGFGSRLFL